MTGWQRQLRLAISAHRRAVFHADRATAHLERLRQAIPRPDSITDQARRLAADATIAAATITPGALGAESSMIDRGSRRLTAPEIVHVRLGSAHATDDTDFPAVVPLLGLRHLVIDADAANPQVAGLLNSLLVRLAAAVDRLDISLVDCVTLGQTFAAAAPLVSASVIEPIATDLGALERVLAAAERRVQDAHQAKSDGRGLGDLPYQLIVIAGLPPQPSKALLARIAALAHAGPHGRTHLIVAGWRGQHGHDRPPSIEHGCHVSIGDGARTHRVQGIPVPVTFDGEPPPGVTGNVYSRLCERRRDATRLDMTALLPSDHGGASSVAGLSTVVGRDARGDVVLSFDDATPHWLIGGRTGGGKTVFLLDVLYGLAARYGPDELALYLLDFKEGVSFTEFTPSPIDPSWIPQVRAVGVESDREYGTAMLAALRAELSRRATAMKRAGVTKLSDLRRREPHSHLPRLVAVIDEFHVLFAGNDRLARKAVAHLEELARKGRSYGVHLVLASQTVSGVEALYTKQDSIFGQFPLRVALPGARHVLQTTNTSADAITLGQAVINPEGGTPGFDRLVHFPDVTADGEVLTALRHRLWERRDPTAPQPTVFAGYATQHVRDDPTYRALTPGTARPKVLIGRSIDLDLSTTCFELGPVPGRHVAFVGSADAAADIQHAAVVSLAAQHHPGDATFLLANLTATAGPAFGDIAAELAATHHDHKVLNLTDLPQLLAELTERTDSERPVYLVIAGCEALAGQLSPIDQRRFRQVLKQGPPRGIHLIGWWRSLRGLLDDLGGSSNREDVACLVMMNVPGSEFGPFIGDPAHDYAPRDNRVLAIDRHTTATTLCVPFARPDRQEKASR
ncbi:FtsK/SpoIIIE domain-containing protein [Stackebrandtia soli]|uniref:FtsK/SpoIIIE domain-containing protein n=1 Tax=Stackebrandtia soli TaxID=1892856 RepID=UPI0039EC1E79